MSTGELTRVQIILRRREQLERVAVRVITMTRKDLDLSQTELGWRVVWTRNQVANLESGRKGIYLCDFVLVAEALHIPPDGLLNRIVQWKRQWSGCVSG